MDSKQIVLIGLVCTSFLTSLVLVDFLPVVVLAILFLTAGIVATYYIALNRKRREQVEEMGSVLKVNQALHMAESLAELSAQLCLRVRRIVNCESAFLWIKESSAGEELAYWPGWDKVSEDIVEKGEPLMVNERDKELFPQPLPEDIKSFMGIPLKKGESTFAVLYLLNSSKGFFDDHDRELTEAIALQASLALSKFHSSDRARDFYDLLIKSVIKSTEASNAVFAGHAERVTAISLLLGRKLGLEKEEMQILKYSALLHDIGQTVIEGKMLKGSTEDSREEVPLSIKDHPRLGAEMLPVTGVFPEIRQGIYYHHERYDGSGYPDGLARTEIPFSARIIAVADIYDAMTRLGAEEERLAHWDAIKEIKRGMGSFFDPLVVVALEEVEAELEAISKDNRPAEE